MFKSNFPKTKKQYWTLGTLEDAHGIAEACTFMAHQIINQADASHHDRYWRRAILFKNPQSKQ